MLLYLTSSCNNQAAEAEAAREARAKVKRETFLFLFSLPTRPQVIAAEGEQKASKSLAEASKVMSETGAALQLRYLQVRQRDFSLKFKISQLPTVQSRIPSSQNNSPPDFLSINHLVFSVSAIQPVH